MHMPSDCLTSRRASSRLFLFRLREGFLHGCAGMANEDWIAVYWDDHHCGCRRLFSWKVIDLRNVVSTYRWTTDGQIASRTVGGSVLWTPSQRALKPRTRKNSQILPMAHRHPSERRPQGDRQIRRATREAGRTDGCGALGREIRGTLRPKPGRGFSLGQSLQGALRGDRMAGPRRYRFILLGARWGCSSPASRGLVLAWLARLLRGTARSSTGASNT